MTRRARDGFRPPAVRCDRHAVGVCVVTRGLLGLRAAVGFDPSKGSARAGAVDAVGLRRRAAIDQVCRIAVRNPQIVSVGRHYGADGRLLRGGRPPEQGWLRGDSQCRQGRHRPDRSQPPSGLCGLLRVRARARGLLRAGQHTRASECQGRSKSHPLSPVEKSPPSVGG